VHGGLAKIAYTVLNMQPSAETHQYFYPNRIGRILLNSMQTAMGRERLDEVLRVSELTSLKKLPPNNLEKKFPFEWVSGLQAAAEAVYGERAGRSLNTRIGRLCFNNGLRDFEPVAGIDDLPMRLMPLNMKFRVGLEVFARVFNQFSDQVVRLSEGIGNFVWIIDRNPVCWGRRTTEPCCQLTVGILEELTFWGSGGRRFKVEETECVAVGAQACIFQIDKKAMD